VADRTKFHPSTGSGHRLDEHVDPDIAKALPRYGIDVTTTVDAGLRTEDDPVHLDFIRRKGRVVVTHDADFLRYASRNSDHPGIAHCHTDFPTGLFWPSNWQVFLASSLVKKPPDIGSCPGFRRESARYGGSQVFKATDVHRNTCQMLLLQGNPCVINNQNLCQLHPRFPNRYCLKSTARQQADHLLPGIP
jgi:hypothetical protein